MANQYGGERRFTSYKVGEPLRKERQGRIHTIYPKRGEFRDSEPIRSRRTDYNRKNNLEEADNKGLGRRLLSLVFSVGFLGATLGLVSNSMTGNAVLNIPVSSSNYFASIFFVLGLLFLFLVVKKQS